MIAGITGGRNYRLTLRAINKLNELKITYYIEQLVSGNCPTGIDKECEDWAKLNYIKIKLFPARWDLYGKKAGPKRNFELCQYLKKNNGLLIYFAGGRGTKNCVDNAFKNNIQLIDLSGDEYVQAI